MNAPSDVFSKRRGSSLRTRLLPWSDADPRDALALRRWAIRVLCGDIAPAPPASAATWDFFLTHERCALPLGAAILDANAEIFASPAREALMRAQMIELRTALGAAAEMARIAELAADLEECVIVLKGGAAIASGLSVYSKDLDILTTPAAIARLASTLADAGYHAGEDRNAPYHLAPRRRESGTPIELHHALRDTPPAEELLARAEPSGAPGLLQMSPADQLPYLIRHSVRQHPDRTGRLRDAIMIAHFLTRIDPPERDRLEKTMPAAMAMDDTSEGRLLALSRAIADHTPVADPFEEMIDRRYRLQSRLGGAPLISAALTRAVLMVSDGRSWGDEREDVMRLHGRAPSSAFFGFVGRLPLVGPSLLTAARLARSALGFALARSG